MKHDELKRISIMIATRQHEKIHEEGLNISGLIRDLIDDHFSEHKITLAVNEETRQIYNGVIANSGATDIDIEPHFRDALKKVLDKKIKAMQSLRSRIK